MPYFLDTPVVFRAKSRIDEIGLTFEPSTLRIDYASDSKERAELHLKNLCGSVLHGAAPNTKYWKIVDEGPEDDETAIHTVTLVFDGLGFSKKMRLELENRRQIVEGWAKAVETAKQSNQPPPARPVFETTPEEALYSGFVRKQLIQFDVVASDANEHVELKLKLDYSVPRELDDPE